MLNDLLKPFRRAVLILPLLLVLLTPAAHAHVGSKDVFETAQAGPYQLFVTVRPPDVIPGVATVEVRVSGAAPVSAIRITPIPLTGEASKHPPTADLLTQSKDDPAFYTGGVWMMASGSWQVRLQVEGPAGPATASVPVPAVAIATLKMQPALGSILAALGLFLLVTMAGLVAAAVRESRLPPGTLATPERRRRSLIATVAASAVMLLMVAAGAKWWNVEAATYAGHIYRPLVTSARLSAGNTLDLEIQPIPGDPRLKLPGRSNADFLPDHGKLIHLYAIRQPQMDAAFHLHPTLAAPGDFRMTLPTMPPGPYTFYGDIVHASGFPETLVTHLDIPANLPSAPLAPDDAQALPTPLSAGPLGTIFRLPDGYTMVWDRPATLTASTPYVFHFRLLDPSGTPARDTEPYLGMAGHAAFVKTDGTVFAHTHPEGSAPMPAVLLANPLANSPMQSMPTMTANKPISPEVDFPYGFATPGPYRLFIQMKHTNTVETAVFDAQVR